MFLVTITNWKKKIIYLVSILVLTILVLTLIPILTKSKAVNTEGKEEDILNQPIKVQSQQENK